MRRIQRVLEFSGKAFVVLGLFDLLVYAVFYLVYVGAIPVWGWMLMGIADASLLVGYFHWRYDILNRGSSASVGNYPLAICSVLVVVAFLAAGVEWLYETISPLGFIAVLPAALIAAAAVTFCSMIGRLKSIRLPH